MGQDSTTTEDFERERKTTVTEERQEGRSGGEEKDQGREGVADGNKEGGLWKEGGGERATIAMWEGVEERGGRPGPGGDHQ